MDREAILKKAQAQGDEMVIRTKGESMNYAYIVLVLSAAVFSFVRDLHGQPMMDLCATVCYSVFAGKMYCFVKTKRRSDLILALTTFVCAVIATVRFFMGH